MFKNHFVKLEGRAQRKEDARALTENRNAVSDQIAAVLGGWLMNQQGCGSAGG